MNLDIVNNAFSIIGLLCNFSLYINAFRILIIVVITIITPIIVFMLLPVIVLESVAVILVIIGIPVDISLFLLSDKYC